MQTLFFFGIIDPTSSASRNQPRVRYKSVRPLGSCTQWHEPMHLPHNEATRLQRPVCVLVGKSNKLRYCVCFLRGEANKDSRSWPTDPSQKQYLTAWQEKWPKEYEWQLYSLKIIVRGRSLHIPGVPGVSHDSRNEESSCFVICALCLRVRGQLVQKLTEKCPIALGIETKTHWTKTVYDV